MISRTVRIVAPALIALMLSAVSSRAFAAGERNTARRATPCVPEGSADSQTKRKANVPVCPPGKPVPFVAAPASSAAPAPEPPAAVATRGKKVDTRAVVSVPSFRMLANGSSRIFVQAMRKIDVVQHDPAGYLVYVIKDARVPLLNNRYPLITQYFNTPATAARLLQAGQDVHLIIDLRAPTQPAARVIELEPGRSYGLQVDFPPGNFVTQPSEASGRRLPTNAPAAPPPPTRDPQARDSVLGPPAP